MRQTLSAMKVGTDGVILGAWANVDFDKQDISVLDVGTGTGLIALMVAQRGGSARVEAVEVEADAAKEAGYNFGQSPFSERLSVVHQDFQSFAKQRESQGVYYDLIVSNPPYFNGSYKSMDAQRMAARHTELLPTTDLIEGVLRLIEPNSGRFAAIFPFSDAAIFIAKAASMGLYCNRLLEIYPKEGKQPKRMAAEFSRTRVSDVVTEELTILNSEGVYSEGYRRLTYNFYHRF